MIEPFVAWLVVVVFAFVNGINDGGTVMSVALRASGGRPWPQLLALVGLLAVVPLVVTTRVAVTLSERLVTFEGALGRGALLAAVVATMLVVWLLTRRGLPTSLTLGLVGALAGAGLGAGLDVGWLTILAVLAVAAVAPALGALGSILIHRVAVPVVGATMVPRRTLAWSGHLVQSLAYGANDGQKMLAVMLVALGSAGGPATLTGQWTAVVAVFAVGSVVGIAKIGPTIDTRILPVRSEQVAIAQLSGGVAVLSSAVVASPVSLTQSVAGGLVGSGVNVSLGRVRWAGVAQIGVAWMITLPAAFVAGAVASFAIRTVTV